jgi:hypothetical protein
MDENELPKKILRTNPGGQRGRDRPKPRWIDGVEEGNWVVEFGGWMTRLEHVGDICLRRPRPARAAEQMVVMIMMMMIKS